MTASIIDIAASRSRTRPAATTGRASVLPTRLRPADLLRITDEGAADILDGRYNYLLPAEWDRVERWSARLTYTDDFDVWLISWTPGRSTELHDHAGSLGALTVVSGSLTEHRWTGDALRSRVLHDGDQASFPLGWVHDVVANPIVRMGPTPTLSVHAYSPPLTTMSYYETNGAGSLRRTRTVLTDMPE